MRRSGLDTTGRGGVIRDFTRPGGLDNKDRGGERRIAMRPERQKAERGRVHNDEVGYILRQKIINATIAGSKTDSKRDREKIKGLIRKKQTLEYP